MSSNATENPKLQSSSAANGQESCEAPKDNVNYDYSFQNQQHMGYAAPPVNDYYSYSQMPQYSYFGDNWSNVGYGQGGQMQDYGAAGGQQAFPGYGYPVDQFSSWGSYSEGYPYFGDAGQAVGSARGPRSGYGAEYYSEEGSASMVQQPPASSSQDYQRPASSNEYQRPSNGEMDAGVSQIEQGIKGVALGDKETEGTSSYGGSGGGKKSWASIASQPARSLPHAASSQKPRGRGPQPMNTFEPKPRGGRGGWGGRSGGRGSGSYTSGAAAEPAPAPVERRPQREEPSYANEEKPHPKLEELMKENEYNPKSFNLAMKGARFFVIKSYSEDDIHRAIKHNIWCSTETGNKRLDSAFKERADKGPIYLFYSVNGSGHFCGVARMMSGLDYSSQTSIWAQDKWKGRFDIKWIYVKDVPNHRLRHILLENNDNKPVTNSRDTQEVPSAKGREVLDAIHSFKHSTSIFDDFSHYEKRQEEETQKKPSRR